MRDFWILAHRGASHFAPENTVIAMQKAFELSAKWVEFDVTLSADGVLFVFHDANLERTSNGYGFIAKTSAAELKQLDAGSWFNSCFSDVKIPELKDVLICLARNNMAMNLEIKPHDSRIELLVDNILAALKSYWPETLIPPIISSFSIEALRHMRRSHPTIWLGLLLDEWDPNWQTLADELACKSIHLNHTLITPERVSAIKATGRQVLCLANTVDNAKKLITQGVDGLFSDILYTKAEELCT